MIEPKIVCMSLPELMSEDLSGVDLREWTQLAGEIWEKHPFDERMSPEARILNYGARLKDVYGRVCFAKVGEKLAGYIWGYSVDEEDLQKISGDTTELKQYFGGVRTVWYLDAAGVLEEFRGKGIARVLFRCLIDQVSKFGFTYMIFRTEIDTIRKIGREFGFDDTCIYDRHYTERNYYVLEL
jgi:GNAT superfamily N-acetyltransferase